MAQTLFFFIVSFSKCASLFTTVCLLFRNFAVFGARHSCAGGGARSCHPWRHPASSFSQNLQFFLQAHFYLIPIVLSGVSFSLGFPLLFFSLLAFSSLPLGFLCKQDCFHHCRKHPLSLAGFAELGFCFDRRI